jgi:hypothetical protein
MSDQPWMKFYPRDWRGDQALRVVSLAARGLWMEALCIMHEAKPYGHLLIGAQPIEDAALARIVGSSVEEVQALLVELRAAGVFRQTRQGVIFSKRMTDDHKRSVAGKKAKELALAEAAEKAGKKPPPSSPPISPPSTQKAEARGRLETPSSVSNPTEAKNDFLGPKEIRQAFVDAMGPEWTGSYIDHCTWQDVPERALIPHNGTAARKILGDHRARAVLAKLGLTLLERAA